MHFMICVVGHKHNQADGAGRGKSGRGLSIVHPAQGLQAWLAGEPYARMHTISGQIPHPFEPICSARTNEKMPGSPIQGPASALHILLGEGPPIKRYHQKGAEAHAGGS